MIAIKSGRVRAHVCLVNGVRCVLALGNCFSVKRLASGSGGGYSCHLIDICPGHVIVPSN